MSLTMYPYSGKFEGQLALAPLAYAASLEGADDEYDFSDGWGYVDYYAVCRGPLELTEAEITEHELSAEDVDFAAELLGFIAHENNNGSVVVTWYERGEEAQMADAVGALLARGEF